MSQTELDPFIVGRDDLILVTGATGFIGSRLVENLLERGFRNLRCFTRASSEAARIEDLSVCHRNGTRVEVVKGNLLSREDCAAATEGAALIFHLAAARGEKSFPDAFLNSVVTTRNLLEACLRHKVKQDEIVTEYGKRFGLPYVIVRPGYVYGPGNEGITGRVGVGTFGLFLHLGGSNTIPFTYVDNCVDAITLAGLKKGIDGEVFNVVDDDLPSSKQFLHLYKQNVRRFKSIYVPHVISYALCALWENYSSWSEGQLPPVFNRRGWHAFWKKTRYSNEKVKTSLGWTPAVPTTEGLTIYLRSCREKLLHA